jgi:hypothetical protein
MPSNSGPCDRVEMRKTLLILAAVSLMISCTSGPDKISHLSARYRERHEYESLSRMLGNLRLGMPQAEVERLLGKPDYSPIEGQYYYSSDRRTASDTPIGLIVEYRTTNPRTSEVTVTGKLESFFLGPIGE